MEAERITVKEFSERYDIRQVRLNMACHRGKLNFITVPLSKKGNGGARRLTYIFIDEKSELFIKHDLERKRPKVDEEKYITLKSGVEVKNNLFGKIMNESGYIAPNY